MVGGNYGPAVTLEKPDESFILEMVGYGKETAQMPPDGKLDDTLLQVLYEWIKHWYTLFQHQQVENQTKIHSSKKYWAYKPLERPKIPKVKNSDWG